MRNPPFQLRILGPTELIGAISDDGEALVRQPKRLALLAYLAVATADGFRRRDTVIGLFWPEFDQAQARTHLRKALHGIREALGEEVFISRGEEEIRLDQAKVWCDAVALAQRVLEERWSEALALYRGELLEGFFPEGVGQEFEEWLAQERKAARQRAAQSAAACARIEEERGDRGAAVVMARRAVDFDRDDEEAVRTLMALLDRRGDRGGALRVYSEWQARLQKEFGIGVEPAPETRKLARKVQAARKGESHDTNPVQSPIAAAAAAPPAEPGFADVSALRVALQEPPRPQFSPHDNSRSATFRTRWTPYAAAGVLLIAVLVVAVLVVSRDGRGVPRGGPRSIAVLPLRTIGDAGLQSAADAVAEEITTALALDTTVTVRPGTRAEDTGGGNDPSEIGRRLDVAYVVDGAVQRGAGRLRVTLRLLRAFDGVAVWASSYDAEEADQVAMAQRVAREAANAIRARLPTSGAGSPG